MIELLKKKTIKTCKSDSGKEYNVFDRGFYYQVDVYFIKPKNLFYETYLVPKELFDLKN